MSLVGRVYLQFLDTIALIRIFEAGAEGLGWERGSELGGEEWPSSRVEMEGARTRSL